MPQTDPQRRVLQALSDGERLSPQGTAKVQVRRGTAYIAIPAHLVDHYESQQSDELQRASHPESSCLVIPLDDSTELFEV
jgi:hypothetical protein